MSKLLPGSFVRGFTIVELLVVIVVVGILATLGIVAYNGVTNTARDNTVLSDAEAVAAEVTFYGVNNNGQYGSAVEWYSGGSPNANINFTPSNGNIIDVVASSTDYCIRIYNPSSKTYTDLYSAAIKESSAGSCGSLGPSTAAIDGDVQSGEALVATVVVGQGMSCALTLASNAYCWGENNSGRLGDGSTSNSSVPVAVTTSGVLSGKTIKTIDLNTGTNYVCAIASDDLVYCWGSDSQAQLGNGAATSSSVPVAVDTSGVLSGKTVKKLAIATWGACVIASDDLVYCWGDGYQGKLGNNSSTDASSPVAVTTTGVLSGKTVKSIAKEPNSTCVIASDDRVYCWGAGSNGRLGNNSTSNSSVPVAVTTTGVLSGKTIKSMSRDSSSTCVIASDDLAYCWGTGTSGQLGNNSTSNSSVPVAVNTAGVLSGKTIKSITVHGSSVCAIASDDQAYCWGGGTSGQLGNNSTSNSSVPVAVTTTGVLLGKTIKSMIRNSSSTCAIASDDRAYCWGDNSYGQLGDNTTNNSSVPVAVTTTGALSGKTIASLALNTDASNPVNCVLASNKKIYCWGQGFLGQVGNGSTSNALAPVAATVFGL